MNGMNFIFKAVLYLISQIQNIFQIFTHPMMFNGEEDSVEDDAEGDDHIEEGVIDDGVEDVLGLEPALVVKTAALTSSTVPVTARL